jgi:exonuclease V gamma subunit
MDNQFKVTGDKNANWQSKPGAAFMDKSLQINADTILENVKQVMSQMKENASLRELNKKMIMALAAYQTAMVANPAFAEGGSELAKQLNGQVSYSKFLEGVKEHIIEKVRVEPNGRTADFITTEGLRG